MKKSLGVNQFLDGQTKEVISESAQVSLKKDKIVEFYIDQNGNRKKALANYFLSEEVIQNKELLLFFCRFDNKSIFDFNTKIVVGKMILALGGTDSNALNIEVEFGSVKDIHELILKIPKKIKAIIFSDSPIKNNNIYSFDGHTVLETYSPVLFDAHASLKKNVWEDFKAFKQN